MEQFNTSHYNINRKEDGTLVRIDGLGGETPEMDVAYYEAQIAFHKQVVANLEAQKAKVEAFELENPFFIEEWPEASGTEEDLESL